MAPAKQRLALTANQAAMAAEAITKGDKMLWIGITIGMVLGFVLAYILAGKITACIMEDRQLKHYVEGQALKISALKCNCAEMFRNYRSHMPNDPYWICPAHGEVMV